MAIPVGTRYTAEVSGRSIKAVSCGRCSAEFVYVLERAAKGEGTSWLWLDNAGARSAAAEVAQRRLKTSLASAVDPVACPACGWYQIEMVVAERKRRGKWLIVTALACAGLAAFCAYVAWLDESGFAYTRRSRTTWNVVAWLAIVAAAAAVARHFRCTVWDPNVDTKWKRRRQPNEVGRAMLKTEFDRLGADSGAATTDRIRATPEPS